MRLKIGFSLELHLPRVPSLPFGTISTLESRISPMRRF